MSADPIQLLAQLDDGNVKAFLHTIRVGEGTADPDGYRRHFGGTLFDSYADHPRKVITAGMGNKQYSSSAAGAYQFLTRTWTECAQLLGLRDFSPKCQDIAALFLIRRAGALDDVIAGRIKDAIVKCAPIWASLPTSSYGQPTKSMEQALATYASAGGLLHPQDLPVLNDAIETIVAATETRETPMSRTPEQTMPLPLLAAAPAVISAVWPMLAAAIPALGKLYSSGSPMAERNLAAMGIAADIVTKAVGATNVQEAAEIVSSRPEAAQVAQQAVRAAWADLTEAGGGGIDGARKADVAFVAAGSNPLKSPAFIITLLVLAMPFMLLADVFFVNPGSYDSALRTQIVTAILMVVSAVLAYWLGSSFGSQRKDEIKAQQ